MPEPTTSFFGPGSKIEGSLEIDGEVRLQGNIQGKVSSTSIVTVGEQANIQANITAPTVIVQGLVRGEIHAKERLELHRTAKVYGTLRATRIRIDEGALFEGECRMAEALAAPGKPATSAIGPTTATGPTPVPPKPAVAAVAGKA